MKIIIINACHVGVFPCLNSKVKEKKMSLIRKPTHHILSHIGFYDSSTGSVQSFMKSPWKSNSLNQISKGANNIHLFERKIRNQKYIKKPPIQVMIDHELIVEALLNQCQSAKNDDLLFDMMDSKLLQAHITEHSLERIRLSIEQLQDEEITREIINELQEIIKVSPFSNKISAFITNNNKFFYMNKLSNCVILSVTELHQRFCLEGKIYNSTFHQ